MPKLNNSKSSNLYIFTNMNLSKSQNKQLKFQRSCLFGWRNLTWESRMCEEENPPYIVINKPLMIIGFFKLYEHTATNFEKYYVSFIFKYHAW